MLHKEELPETPLSPTIWSPQGVINSCCSLVMPLYGRSQVATRWIPLLLTRRHGAPQSSQSSQSGTLGAQMCNLLLKKKFQTGITPKVKQSPHTHVQPQRCQHWSNHAAQVKSCRAATLYFRDVTTSLSSLSARPKNQLRAADPCRAVCWRGTQIITTSEHRNAVQTAWAKGTFPIKIFTSTYSSICRLQFL